MANYNALDAFGSILTVASSTIGGVQYPVFKFADAITVNPSSVSGTVLIWNTVTVSGNVGVTGNPSISGTVNIGNTVPITLSGNPSISGTVNIGVMPGSVVAFQGGIFITSITGIPSVSGTVNIGNTVTINPASVSGSVGIVGTPSVSGALTAMGKLNVAMSSVVANSVIPIAVGGIGEQITANAPLTQWVQGIASCFTGVIQPIIPAQGSSIFSYITSLQVTNASANAVYLTFYGASSSVVGFLPVPANGGAVPVMPNGWKTSANGAFSASVSGVASVFLSASGLP